MKKGKKNLGCARDMCFAKIVVKHNDSYLSMYCELEKGHKGNHQSALIWENLVKR